MAKIYRTYKDFTTASYKEALLSAWACSRSPLAAAKGVSGMPPLRKHIASFLLELTPPPPPISAESMERRRRLECLADLVGNPAREDDKRQVRSEEINSLDKVERIVKEGRHILVNVTRVSITLSCARTWLTKRDAVGLFPKPVGWHMREMDEDV